MLNINGVYTNGIRLPIIKFKYDVIPQIEFIYADENKVRNPYGRKGKS